MLKVQRIQSSINKAKADILGAMMLNPPSPGFNSKIVNVFLEQQLILLKELSEILYSPRNEILKHLYLVLKRFWEVFESLKGLMNERNDQLTRIRV